MDRSEVKHQEEKFEEVLGILKLDITMAKRQHNNKKKRDKKTAFFTRTGLWGSGSTGKQATKLLKTYKNRPSQLQW